MKAMQEKGIADKCVKTVLEFSKISAVLADEFFVSKIRLLLEDLLSAYFELDKDDTDSNVAQYRVVLFNKTLEQLLDILKDLRHFNLVETTPLLYAQKALLELKITTTLKLKKARIPIVQASMEQQAQVQNNYSKRNLSLAKLTDSQEKILKFVDRTKMVRTKDIIDEFSSLSERTVKRSLKELVGQGRLQKKSENKAVYYLIA